MKITKESRQILRDIGLLLKEFKSKKHLTEDEQTIIKVMQSNELLMKAKTIQILKSLFRQLVDFEKEIEKWKCFYDKLSEHRDFDCLQ